VSASRAGTKDVSKPKEEAKKVQIDLTVHEVKNFQVEKPTVEKKERPVSA
jgi:hypothetical protein